MSDQFDSDGWSSGSDSNSGYVDHCDVSSDDVDNSDNSSDDDSVNDSSDNGNVSSGVENDLSDNLNCLVSW